jgi:hypothetical protein
MTEQNNQINDDSQENMKVWSGEDWSTSGRSSWIWGAGLLVIGAAFLIQNIFGIRIINPWNFWAIFLIIPGLSMLTRAWEGYQYQNSLSGKVGSTAGIGALLLLLGLSFLFDFGISLVWPSLIILLGIYLLISARR